MNKKEFYKAQGKLSAGVGLDYDEQGQLMSFAETLVSIIEETEADTGEYIFGTEGWEHAIGWE